MESPANGSSWLDGAALGRANLSIPIWQVSDSALCLIDAHAPRRRYLVLFVETGQLLRAEPSRGFQGRRCARCEEMGRGKEIRAMEVECTLYK